MKTYLLKRIAMNDFGTFGVLLDELGIPFVLTLERPWKDNKKGESCIPVGTYKCLRCRKSPDYDFKDSPQHGNTFQVYAVPERSYVLFHIGNIDDDTHGCILIGEYFGFVKNKKAVEYQPGIGSSGLGYGEFMSKLAAEDEFTLRITEV